MIEPFEHGRVDVGDGHDLYWEAVGRPDGEPVVYLHGGPGSGAGAGARELFDPTRHRAVLFDQRGCGRSRPLASDVAHDLVTNTTAHLVADIEALRVHTGVERWQVVGTSWGSTLALTYAQRHPERVTRMVLGPVTAGTRRELDWITRGVGRIFPEAWEAFRDGVPPDERDGELAAAYAGLLAHPDAEVRRAAAWRWCEWEDTHVSLQPGWRHAERYDDPEFRLVFATLVTHYWGNGCFLADKQLFDGLHRIADIPAVLVHGRHDISGPLDTAWRLHRAWPSSRLVVIEDGGHGGRAFGRALRAAITET